MSASSRGSRTKVKQQTTKPGSTAFRTTLTSSPPIDRSKDMETEEMDTSAPEPSMQLLAEAAQNDSRGLGNGIANTRDREERSSSLSDIDDRPATEVTDHNIEQSSQVSEEEDTEAETERLEETPRKERKQKKVLLSADNTNGATSVAEDEVDDAEEPTQSTEAAPADAADQGQNGAKGDIEVDAHSSASSSLGDSGEGSLPDSLGTSESKKRKRTSEDDETATSLKKVALELANHVADQVQEAEEASSPLRAASIANDADPDEGNPSEDESVADENGEGEHRNGEDADNRDAADSAGEEVDMDDAGQEADPGSSIRSEEELKKKKAALNMLSKIENNFAVLRDKLFADKNNQLAVELATIQSDCITHPEYLAMVEAIGNLRRDRIEYARTVFRYKFQALETKSIANRAQLHSQYFQAIRQLRESSLENASKEWYQIQRERRNIDEDVTSTLNHFNGNRSQLVAQQSAYNLEVSVLSGVAKYVGFPAAPEIQGADHNEIEEDLRNMGISRNQVSVPVPHFVRQTTGAEEQFLEQNPWANAQHPYHSQVVNNQNRQVSGHVRSTSPFTPIGQKRAGEGVTQGSTSTIPALPSSSIAPTPMSNEPGPSSLQQARTGLETEATSYTPSKAPEHDVPLGTRKGLSNNESGSINHTPLPAEKARRSRSPGVSQKLAAAAEEVNAHANSSPPRHTAHTLAESLSPEDSRIKGGFPQHSGLPARVEVGNA